MTRFPPLPDYIAADARRHLLQDKGNIRAWLIEDDLEELRLFHTTLEKFIEEEETREVEALSKHASINDSEFWAEHYPYQWQQVIGSQLRKSFIVSLMSLLEFNLRVICRDVATVTGAKITHEDLKGSIFIRANKFLAIFAQFTAPSQGEWELVGDLYALRNNIVHNAALVDSDRKSSRLEVFIRKTPGISIPSAGMLEMRAEFCNLAVNTIETFLKVLQNQYVALCERIEASHSPENDR